MLAKNCKGCDHFQDVGHSLGVCRRYPTYQNRSPNERCGEFSALSYGEAVPEMLALPVVNLPVTSSEAEEHEQTEKTKRKYTRKERSE